jgi:hypothetical protein
MGERTVETTGNVMFEDLTNNFKAIIILGTYKKSGYFRVTETGSKDEIKGMIYEYSPYINKLSY